MAVPIPKPVRRCSKRTFTGAEVIAGIPSEASAQDRARSSSVTTVPSSQLRHGRPLFCCDWLRGSVERVLRDHVPVPGRGPR